MKNIVKVRVMHNNDKCSKKLNYAYNNDKYCQSQRYA